MVAFSAPKIDCYQYVPKTLVANLEYRLEIRKLANKDWGFRRALREVCREDHLFWLNAMCIAAGTLVVTRRGNIPIEQVLPGDFVWDGDRWIKQGGSIYRGNKETIFAYGIHLTSDHKVWTDYGWKQAGEGYDRAKVWLPDGYLQARQYQERSSLALPVRLREASNCSWKLFEEEFDEKLRMSEGREGEHKARDVWNIDTQCVDGDVEPVLKSEQQILRSLWRAGHFSLQTMAEVRELFGRHGNSSAWNDIGAYRQQRPLRTQQLPLGNVSRTSEQYQKESHYRYVSWFNDDLASSETSEHYTGIAQVSHQDRPERRGLVCPTNSPRSSKVYDLINCGPKQAFTVIDGDGCPLLVHNCWLYEPRPRFDQQGRKLPKVIPFITWPHQDPVFLEIRRTLGKDDIGLEKSRGEGASWHAIWTSLQDWCFDEMVTIGYVSRNKEAVYNGKDPNSLFWKLDFGRRSLPIWMTGREDKDVGWERNIVDSTFINNRRSNTIIGYAATGNVASGGRTDWFLMDELSKFPRPDDEAAMDSTLSVSDSRLIVGTPLGAVGAYYDVMHESSSMVKCRLHWSDNVSKNRGLYNLINGRPVAVDPVNNPLPKEYDPPSKQVLRLLADLRERGFDLEKGVRSPWYDKQCHRPKVTPQSAAQEFDIDYGGSRHNRFGSEFFKYLHRTVKAPLRRGKLTFNDELKPRFDYVNSGPLLLWVELDHEMKPPKGNYVVGCDVASGFAGSYTSNSTIIVVNLDTQEQVAEFAANNIQQIPFADLAIAIAKWFHNAKLGWEANYASGFAERVLEQNYAYIWARPQLGKRTKHQSGRRELGWWTDNRKTKPLMFDDIDAFVMEKKIQIYSADIRNECARYIVDEKRNIEFEGQSGNQSHGDRVIGFGVCVEMMKEHRIATGNVDPKKRNPPPNSMEARERDWEREEEDKEDDWDHTTPSDLVAERSALYGGDTYKGEFGWS